MNILHQGNLKIYNIPPNSKRSGWTN